MKLTNKEKQAIKALNKLASMWPRSLELFGWSGKLHVQKVVYGCTFAECDVAEIIGIRANGGDPDIRDTY